METLITIVEVPPFDRLAASCMTEDELDSFKYFIATNPDAGVRIQRTGGVRKVRWATGGAQADVDRTRKGKAP